jgi:hypothetical protein
MSHLGFSGFIRLLSEPNRLLPKMNIFVEKGFILRPPPKPPYLFPVLFDILFFVEVNPAV